MPTRIPRSGGTHGVRFETTARQRCRAIAARLDGDPEAPCDHLGEHAAQFRVRADDRCELTIGAEQAQFSATAADLGQSAF